MKVVVTGASGYVGHTVVTALSQAGHDVKGLARHKPASLRDVRWAAGDARDMNLVEAFEGADAVVHLIGIIREIPQKGVTFDAMHVGVTDRVLSAMRAASVSRLVHMSALGTRRHAVAQYHRTKWQAEQLVWSRDGIQATILRPSLLFGGAPPFFEMLTNLARLPRVPVPGDGRTLFQPVSRLDVAALICAILTDFESAGLTLEVGGPDRYNLNQLVDVMGEKIGRRHPPKLHLPLGMVSAVARFSSVLPVPITPDQLAMLTEPNVTSDDQWLKWVPHPRPLSSWDSE